MLLKEKLLGMDHIGISVKDIEASVKWYVDTLSCQLIYNCEVPVDEGVVKISFLKLNDITFELYQMPKPEGDATGDEDSKTHLAFGVKNAQSAFDELLSLGFEMLDTAPIKLPIWDKGIKCFNVRGPSGEKMEFVERIQ